MIHIEKNTDIIGRERNQELIKKFQQSFYPDASEESVEMVLSYYREAKIDPMLRLLNIVSRNTKNKATGKWEKRDVIMPGIGFYRLQAERTGEYCGIDEPEFGEDVTQTFDGVKVTYPKWCKVTVKRLVKGKVRKFVAKEFWTENYATAASDTVKPNAIWIKRPYAQIAKCAEAQALRKAFPSLVSLGPIVEENWQREDMDVYEHSEPEVKSSSFEQSIIEKIKKNKVTAVKGSPGLIIGDIKESSAPLGDDKADKLSSLFSSNEEIRSGILKYLEKLEIERIDQLTEPQADKLISRILEKYPQEEDSWSKEYMSGNISQ